MEDLYRPHYPSTKIPHIRLAAGRLFLSAAMVCLPKESRVAFSFMWCAHGELKTREKELASGVRHA